MSHPPIHIEVTLDDPPAIIQMRPVWDWVYRLLDDAEGNEWVKVGPFSERRVAENLRTKFARAAGRHEACLRAIGQGEHWVWIKRRDRDQGGARRAR